MEERNELEKPFLETQGGSDGSIEIRAVPPVISRVYTASSCPEFPDFLPDKLPKLPEVQHVLARRRTSLRRLRYRLASEIPGTSSEHQSRDLPIQRDSDMRSDFRRYKSFRKYNDPWPAPVLFLQSSLADAGFYYVGPGDRVRCFSCGGELDNWEDWDVPLTRHQLSFPDCPYVLELRAEMSPIFGQYQYQGKESLLFPMSERLSQTVPSSSNCPTVQGLIKDPDYSKVESITEGESETSAPPSGSSISGQKPLGTMSDENNRLETYRGHRHHFPYNNQRSLSQAGFYYVGPGDRVRCFSCGGELENWQPGDVPLTRHRRSFPDCPNVLELRAEMFPIFCQYQYLRKESPLLPMSMRLSPTVPSSSNCPTVQGQIKDPDYSKVESITEGESETPAPPSGSSISGQKPLRTMSHENNRLETYRGHRHHFPHNNRQSLSQAGFYYVGPGDRVRCFSCGGELENWEFRNDPLTRHRLSFPDCPYVLERRAKTLPILYRSQTVFASPGLSLIDFSSSHRPRPLSDQDTPMSLHMRNEGERFHSPVTSSSVTRCLKSDSANQEEVAPGQEEELGFGQAEGGASGQAEEMDSVGHKEQTEETCDWPRGSAEECELCGKAPEFPQIRPERTGTKFRLVVPREGLFRCSETGLQFRVESPANIDIEIGSWVEFRGHLHQYTYDIVGPLFNITVKSGRVSAVYLPHYVCLKGGDVDKAMFRVAHYKDDNMILESPTRVEPFYVVLENPTFSPVGVIKLQPSPNGRRRKIPTHGVVMLYSRYKTGYTIHLYLMPRDLSLKQAVHNKETENGFYRVDKPPQTSTIYTEKIYIVGGPEDADIIPEELKLCLDDKSELYPYSEIYLEEIQDKIYLQLTCQGENTSTWRTQLRTEDLETKTKVTQDGRHFIDKHRAALIANMSHIDPVLDDLLGDKILTQEQYDTVRSKSTSQEKMRQLYDCIKTWGSADKDVFYFTLSVHNKSLIKELLHS